MLEERNPSIHGNSRLDDSRIGYNNNHNKIRLQVPDRGDHTVNTAMFGNQTQEQLAMKKHSGMFLGMGTHGQDNRLRMRTSNMMNNELTEGQKVSLRGLTDVRQNNVGGTQPFAGMLTGGAVTGGSTQHGTIHGGSSTGGSMTGGSSTGGSFTGGMITGGAIPGDVKAAYHKTLGLGPKGWEATREAASQLLGNVASPFWGKAQTKGLSHNMLSDPTNYRDIVRAHTPHLAARMLDGATGTPRGAGLAAALHHSIAVGGNFLGDVGSTVKQVANIAKPVIEVAKVGKDLFDAFS